MVFEMAELRWSPRSLSSRQSSSDLEDGLLKVAHELARSNDTDEKRLRGSRAPRAPGVCPNRFHLLTHYPDSKVELMLRHR
jgi:hypothetical protein